MTTSFSSFEAALEKAIADGVLPGAVVAARDKSGSINYLTARGFSSLTHGSEKPMSTHTIFPLASMTKLLTSIAALQLVDRGLITPDSDITPYLPTLASLPILTSVSSSTGEETTTPRTKPILLRHLLTHSSGAGYPFLDPLLKSRLEALTASGNPPPTGPSVSERYGSHPLVFEPGTSWTYGSGVDWAGHLVEVLSGQDLESYLQENILAPLGLPGQDGKKIITFYPERLSEKDQERRMQLTVKSSSPDQSGNNGRVAPLEGEPPLFNPDPSRSVYGGEAGHADLSAYIEILHSLLVDDERLLSKKTARLLFTPMLVEKEAKRGLKEVLKDPSWIVGHFPLDINDRGEYDHSLGGVVVDGDSHQRRKRGFLLWGGMFNLAWFIDREAGVTALFGTSVANPGDPDIEKLFVALEEAVYAEAQAVSAADLKN